MENNLETTEQSALLTLNEARVLACLMEKELTVPDNYPLTLNSLTSACNQKSNREPTMTLPEGEVGHIAKELQKRDLVKIEYGERAHRFEHNVRKSMVIDKRQQALLTVMMLRRPQTLNDLKVRTQRMVEFEDNDDILLTLETLNEFGEKRMRCIPKGPGQREDRYTHLLCGEVNIPSPKPAIASVLPKDENKLAEVLTRIEILEKRIEQLESKFDKN